MLHKQNRLIQTTLFLALCTLLGACSTTQQGGSADDLDISLNTPQPVASSKEIVSDISPEAVFNWHIFFQRHPSTTEREHLQVQTESSSSAKTAADYISLGRKQVALGQLAAAKSNFRNALRLEEDSVETLLELATLSLKQKHSTEAFEFLNLAKDILESSSKSTKNQRYAERFRYRYLLALTFMSKSNVSKGRDILTELIGHQSDFTPAYLALAHSYIREQKHEAAEFVSLRGIDRCERTTVAGLFGVLAEIELRKGHTGRTEDYLEKALSIDSNDPYVLLVFSYLKLRQGDHDLAQENLKRVLAIDPQSAEANVWLGVIYNKRSQLELARQSFESALAIDPDNVQARFNLALMMHKNFNNPIEAKRLFEEVKQVSPPNSRFAKLANTYLDLVTVNN